MKNDLIEQVRNVVHELEEAEYSYAESFWRLELDSLAPRMAKALLAVEDFDATPKSLHDLEGEWGKGYMAAVRDMKKAIEGADK